MLILHRMPSEIKKKKIFFFIKNNIIKVLYKKITFCKYQRCKNIKSVKDKLIYCFDHDIKITSY